MKRDTESLTYEGVVVQQFEFIKHCMGKTTLIDREVVSVKGCVLRGVVKRQVIMVCLS